jgi:hypothetical protein
MRIRITNNNGNVGILICFNSEGKKFDSPSERNKFYRELYGFKQVVTKDGKSYTYQKEGILTEIPHMRVDNSSFIVPPQDIERMESFFREWSEKVHWKMLRVLLDEHDNDVQDLLKMIKNRGVKV